MTTWWAHSENDFGQRHPLVTHLTAVANGARRNAGNCAWESEAGLAGLLHDLGKYGDLFQKRLDGEESGLDHWSTGACAALQHYHSLAAALAIEGHHIGLQCASSDSIRNRFGAVLQGNSPIGHHIRLSESNIAMLFGRAKIDGITFAKPEAFALPTGVEAWKHGVASMLDVRMLFACLVDADYLDTEAHFQGGPDGKRPRAAGPSLCAEQALETLDAFMTTKIHGRKKSSDVVSEVRTVLWSAVTTAAEAQPGLFSLTAPTGSGKTFAMLQFALRHARRNGLKRIVLAVPYLSIIEQTAREYRKVFADAPELFVLEHHSLAGMGAEQSAHDQHDDAERQRRLLSENWDAPIIITTNVQLLESLFSNRPSACRKLHRLRDSVILFDEAQSLPQSLAVPTLAALSHLANAYNSSVVFATATQPAFDTLNDAVRKQAVSGWQPREIVPTHRDMFKKLVRVLVTWPIADEALSWSDLATTLHNKPQALCVLNLKRHAQELLQAMSGCEGLFHLSTNLCSAHRRAVLGDVKQRLDPENPQPCRLVSTQCVEAGVDLDFPIAYRAFAPLEAVAQAAGRCNREGRMNERGQLGEVRVFEPDPAGAERRRMFPTYEYYQAAEVTLSMLRQAKGDLNINDPDVFRRYYQSLYGVSRPADQQRDLTRAIAERDFPEIAARYRLIDQDAIQIVVPWQPERALYKRLREQAAYGINGQWMREAQALSVSIYRPKPDHPAWGCLIPAPFRRGGASDEWFILEDPDGKHYDEILGLHLPQNQLVMIA